MTRAYNESYLNDAMNHLAAMMDCAVYDCGLEADAFFTLFLQSGTKTPKPQNPKPPKSMQD